ncbi:MAG: hypothetical protein R3C44_23475 [Chloroflexota bacterium]
MKTHLFPHTRIAWLVPTVLLLLVVAVVGAHAAQPPAWVNKIDADLLREARSAHEIEFLVLFSGQPDFSAADHLDSKKPRAAISMMSCAVLRWPIRRPPAGF